MNRNQIQLGMRVRANRDFVGVPIGSEGVVDEFYDGGFFVSWDSPNPRELPLPKGYAEWIRGIEPPLVMNKKYRDRMGMRRPLRDGFDDDEAKYLDDLRQVIRSELEL